MDELSKLENDLIERIALLREDILAIQQPRSNFALEHFIVMQHDTPARQWYQVVLELQMKLFAIKRAGLERRRLELEIDVERKNLENASDYGKAISELEIEKLQLDMDELDLSRLGAAREAQCLLAILDKLPRFTREQFEAEEADYWQKRLARQAWTDLRASGTIGQGNLEAIRQLISEVGESAALPNVYVEKAEMPKVDMKGLVGR